MGDPLPTVEVEHPSNPDRKLILNEDDYDPEEYTLWDEGGDEEPEEPQDDGEGEGDPLLDLTVVELREAVRDVDDADRLYGLIGHEGRSTALDAIHDRIDELEA